MPQLAHGDFLILTTPTPWCQIKDVAQFVVIYAILVLAFSLLFLGVGDLASLRPMCDPDNEDGRMFVSCRPSYFILRTLFQVCFAFVCPGPSLPAPPHAHLSHFSLSCSSCLFTCFNRNHALTTFAILPVIRRVLSRGDEQRCGRRFPHHHVSHIERDPHESTYCYVRTTRGALACLRCLWMLFSDTFYVLQDGIDVREGGICCRWSHCPSVFLSPVYTNSFFTCVYFPSLSRSPLPPTGS